MPPESADRSTHSSLTGDIRRLAAPASRYLPRGRELLVYLPPRYDQHHTRHYPVLYLHDGQNVFDGATSHVPGEEWRVDETAERLIAHGAIEPLIIVAIEHASDQRIEEFAPVPDLSRQVTGRAREYGRMLVHEIKPFIDRHFRTRRDQPSTGVGGSSMGGLLTLYLAAHWPGTFGRIAALSPSLWWADGWMLQAYDRVPHKWPQRLWLDVGLREGPEAVQHVRSLRQTLVRRGWSLGDELRYFEARNGDHSERAWAARVGPILRFLFPPARARHADGATTRS